jgi:predicted RNA methylase
MAEAMRQEGERMQKVQTAIRGVADQIDAGTHEEWMLRLNTRAIFEGLFIYGRMTTFGEDIAAKYGITDQDTWATIRETIRELGEKAVDTEAMRKSKLRRMEQEIALSRIPGYFNSPEAVIGQMLDKVIVGPGMRMLEPEAGSGHIADAAKKLGAEVDCVEVNHRLRELLEAKGHNLIGWDFLEMEPNPIYDVILMNPPFEDKQDIRHLRHAYKFLKPGGRVVSVLSAGAEFRDDSETRSFRSWVEEQDGNMFRLPEDSFKESDRVTGVNTVLCCLLKPAAHSAGTLGW